MNLERKFCAGDAPVTLADNRVIEGYASLFGACDQGGDTVAPGAYGRSLERLVQRGGRVKMLWQHDPAQPIGIWDEVCEDARGLYVKGRLLDGVARAEEAAALIGAGAIDGLSIGYRTITASGTKGRRTLTELDLWEVSLVTFPMLAEARVSADGPDGHKHDVPQAARALAETLTAATALLAEARRTPATTRKDILR